MVNSPHKIIVKNFSSMIVAQAIYKIITFFMMIAIARYLGVAQFGQLSYFLSFVWIFMFLSDSGLSDLFIRDVAHERSLKDEYINNIITFKIFTGFFIFIVISILAFILTNNKDQFFVLIILGLSAILDSFMYFFRAIFRAEEKMEYESILLLVEGILKLVVIIMAIGLGFNVAGVKLIALAIFVVSLINFLINFVVFSFRNSPLVFSFDFTEWLRILKSAFPFMSISILTFLNFKINIILLSLIKGDASAGLYNANYKLIEQILLLPITFSAALLPTFSRLSDSLGKLRGFMIKTLFLSLGVSISLVILSYAYGGQIVNLVYGKLFLSGENYLGLFSWILVPFFVKMIVEKLLFGLRKQTALLYIYLYGAAVNLSLNLILISRFAINGALLGTLICEILVVFACVIVVMKSPVSPKFTEKFIEVEKENVLSESML